jgi:sec-independent protein translocase protein TatA
MINPMLGMPQGAEWLVILAIVILVFGAAKLPQLARSTGQALRIFKSETKGLRDDEASDDEQPRPSGELPPAEPSGESDQQSQAAPEQRPGQGTS